MAHQGTDTWQTLGATGAPTNMGDKRMAVEGDTSGADVDILIDHVWKVFTDDTVAVADLSLQIRKGEFFSFLGPSGCGKTTTLRMLAGFEDPTAGTISLQGRPIEGVPPFKRNVNTVFQSYALFPHLSVEKNVAYGLERKKVPKADTRKRVGDMLDLVQLSHLAKRKPAQLSGGQQQRVALARALVNYPAVLLLDEPLGALDLKLRKGMQVELSRIQREVGITFVYVTHDQEEALTMSDWIAVMNGGRLEQVGPPEEIYEKPLTRFVAGFIGTSNVLQGTAASAAEGFVSVEAPGLERVRVPADGISPGDSVQFTVRPEKLELVRADAVPADDRCRVRGRVTDIVYQGVSTQYIVRTESGDQIYVFVQNRHDAEELVAEGEDVVCLWRANHNVVLQETSIPEPGESDDADLTAEPAAPAAVD